jgi:hypothetical protein
VQPHEPLVYLVCACLPALSQALAELGVVGDLGRTTPAALVVGLLRAVIYRTALAALVAWLLQGARREHDGQRVADYREAWEPFHQGGEQGGKHPGLLDCQVEIGLEIFAYRYLPLVRDALANAVFHPFAVIRDHAAHVLADHEPLA